MDKVKFSAEQVQATILLLWAEYYKKSVEEYYEETADSSKYKAAQESLKRLREIGLGASKNAAELQSIVSQYKADENKAKKIEETRTFLQTLKKHFPDVIVLPYAEFFEVLEKFNLACGPVSAYTGLIPEENIAEMDRATKVIEELKGSVTLFNREWKHIRKAFIDKDTEDVEKKVNKLSRFPYSQNHYNGHTWAVSETDWIIAAPVNEIMDNIEIEVFSSIELNKKKLAEDPLALKFTDYGVAIFSAWGEEANLDIFEKYKY